MRVCEVFVLSWNFLLVQAHAPKAMQMTSDCGVPVVQSHFCFRNLFFFSFSRWSLIYLRENFLLSGTPSSRRVRGDIWPKLSTLGVFFFEWRLNIDFCSFENNRWRLTIQGRIWTASQLTILWQLICFLIDTTPLRLFKHLPSIVLHELKWRHSYPMTWNESLGHCSCHRGFTFGSS